jgi:hypothetical protein
MIYDLLGIGNALVDIEVQVEDSFVKKHSLAKGGMTLASAADQARILKSLKGHPTKTTSGGSAANTVHGLSVLGGKSYYIGRVASDAYGHHYTEDMTNCGVGFPGPGAETEGTGSCVVMVTPDTERTMHTHLGISSALHPDNVDPTIVTNSRMVYVEGYLWTGNETRRAALQVTDIAKKAGIPVAFTLSDAFIANSYKSELIDFIRWKVDILFCNEVEGLALMDTDDPDKAFTLLQSMSETVFFTRGKSGAWAATANQPITHAEAFPVKAVDTTGAGDLFAAGAIYGLIKKHSLKEAAIIGSYCAAQVVTHLGGRLPLGAHTDARKILKSYNDHNLK